MDLTSPRDLAQFADDVRQQQEPFTQATVAAFAAMLPAEYRRLRASSLESGSSTATLHIVARFDFSPASRTVELTMVPEATQHHARKKAVAVDRQHGG
jgi:hypothetical protein